MHVVALGADGFPSEIFVFHVMAPDEVIVGDRFEAVASVVQLTELGLAPAQVEGRQIPYYRANELTLWCASPEERSQVWERIKLDVEQLARDFALTSSLTLDREVTIAAA